MIVLIVAITIILYVVLIAFTFKKLSFATDNKIKIAYIIIGLFIMFIVTLIVFNLSSSGINFENAEVAERVKNMLLAVFVPVNGLIIMPYVASLFGRASLNEIDKDKFKKRLIILIVIFIIIMIFEYSYFKSTQQGIVNMINNK